MSRLTIVATVTLLLIMLVHASARHDRAAHDLSSPAVADEVLVRMHPAFLNLSNNALDERLGGYVADRLPALDTLRLRLEDDESVGDAIDRIEAIAGVTLVEPNYRLESTIAPNDPFFTAQSAYLGIIGAENAWQIERGELSVLVAVLDSGIDLDHPDLKEKVWTNIYEVADNGIDDDNNGCVDDLRGCSFVAAATVDSRCTAPPSGKVTDDNGHGSFVSGIIAAQGDNGVGLIGAAPGVGILPVKILDCLGGGTAMDASQGILYAARNGARVANISFGADGESTTLANAIREAHDKYGMVVVAATGNEGLAHVTFPARLPQTIAVASSGAGSDPDARSPFSDWGPQVSVAAPGQNVVSTVPPAFCGTLWLCVEGQPYAVASGTSFAAPLVSGLAALIISHNPNIGPESVREIMSKTATPLPDGTTANWDGAGRIRMSEALGEKRYFIGAAGLAHH